MINQNCQLNVQKQNHLKLRQKRKPIERLIDFTLLIHHQLKNQDKYFTDLIDSINAVQLQEKDNKQMNNSVLKLQLQMEQERFLQVMKQNTNEKQNQIKQINKDHNKEENKQNKKQQQYELQNTQYNSIKNNDKSILQSFKDKIINKQKQAFQQLFNNLMQINIKKTESFILEDDKKIKTIKQKTQNQISIQQKQKNNSKIDEQKSKIDEQKSKIDEAKGFCKTLKQQFNKQKIYNQKNINNLVYHLNQIYANNSYLCTQDTFQYLKGKYHLNINKNQIRNSKLSKSSLRKSQIDPQFNLQLTIKSKISKNSINIDRQDSLIYSNATSFGLNSTNNKSKQANKNNNVVKSTKIINITSQNDLDVIHMDKTSSKGDVQNQQKSFSAKSFSDTQRVGKYPPRMSYQNKSNRNSGSKNSSKNSSQQRINLTYKQLQDIQVQKLKRQLQNKKSPIKEQDNYQILSYQNQNIQDNNIQNQQNYNNSPFNQKVKKSFSIKSHNSRKIGAKINGKKSQQYSVFSSQINILQTRIGRIKQNKMLKKKKLQEQLNKINQQIQQLKGQQLSRQKQQNYHQNTMESRIKINDNLQEKKKAAKLVKNLRAQKMSRQNIRKRQINVIDKDIHQKMQQIMKLKYFNQQKIKQKKKLQVIQRMKQQQIRKIAQQQQKQNSLQFLSKLKNGSNANNRNANNIPNGYSRQIQEMLQNKSNKKIFKDIVQKKIQKKLNQSRDKAIYRTPKKMTQAKELQQPSTNPILQKKKAYLNKIRNFTVIKRQRQDIYQQALN